VQRSSIPQPIEPETMKRPDCQPLIATTAFLELATEVPAPTQVVAANNE
jgi:hypothetical protein